MRWLPRLTLGRRTTQMDALGADLEFERVLSEVNLRAVETFRGRVQVQSRPVLRHQRALSHDPNRGAGHSARRTASGHRRRSHLVGAACGSRDRDDHPGDRVRPRDARPAPTHTAFGALLSIEPAFGILIGLLVLAQTPTLMQLLGIAIVIAAGAAAQRGGARTADPVTTTDLPASATKETP